MIYTKLPKVNDSNKYELEYFPSRFHAAVFRLWETVRAAKIASVLGTSEEVVNKAALDMGLPEQEFNSKWEDRGYITTIRNAWHILPYDQILALLEKCKQQPDAPVKLCLNWIHTLFIFYYRTNHHK